MRRIISFIVAAAALLPLCVTVSAQDIADTLASTTITAEGKPSAAKSTAPVQSLTVAELGKLGIGDITRAVNTFAGVQIRDYGGIGGVKTVSIRSLGGQHTAVSYDGVTISNAQNGQIDIGRFNLENVQMLSLNIGADDNIFRSARSYASAGVLNITTRKPDYSDKRFHAGVGLKAASFLTFNPSLYFDAAIGKNWSLGLNADYLHTNGDYPFTVHNGTETTTYRRLNSDVNTVRAEANVFGDLGRSGSLSLKGSFMWSERGLPGAVILYVQDPTERLWDRLSFAQARYENHWGIWSFQAQAKFSNDFTRYSDKKAIYPGGEKLNIYTQNEYYLSAVVRVSPLKGLSISLAQDVAVNTLDANLERFVYPLRVTSLTALAAQYHISFFTATASVLGTYVHDKVKVGEAQGDKWRFTPCISLSFEALPWLRIRAMYQDLFRTPTFNELYYTSMGNTKLKPELARQVNLGLTIAASPLPEVLSWLEFTADGYFNSVRDKIVCRPTMFLWSTFNMGKVNIGGLDLSLSTRWRLPHLMGIEFGGHYSFQHAVDVTDKEEKTYGHQIPYTPRHSGNVSLVFSTPWINLSYMMTAVGERYSWPQNTAANRLDPYMEHTIALYHNFEWRRCSLLVQGECINLANAQYEVIHNYPMPGRTWQLTLKFKY
ncbi:MAG: TonB-dependent receptor [Bacteroidales bacterium]|nr:TonB-dependent receptor [Bacteroidales bacterium]